MKMFKNYNKDRIQSFLLEILTLEIKDDGQRIPYLDLVVVLLEVPPDTPVAEHPIYHKSYETNCKNANKIIKAIT